MSDKIIKMDNANETDSFFFTKNNMPQQSLTARSLPHISQPTSRTVQMRKDSIQDMFDNYQLFKYSLCDVGIASVFNRGGGSVSDRWRIMMTKE